MQRNPWLGSLTLVVMLVIGMMSTNSCIFDAEKEDTPPDTPPVVFEDLTQREHILTNLRLAYTQKNGSQYQRLLDEDFTFFFGQADLDDNKVSSPQWGRVAEVRSAVNLFDPSFDPPGEAAPVSQIGLNMTWPVGENTWTEISSPGGTETWHEKTVQYTLVVTAGETVYSNASALTASFVIRFDPVDEHYKIIQWRDDL